MSRDGSVEIAWAGELRRFRLGIGQLRELQERCDAGPLEIYDRLSERRWRVDDVREPIRLGLLGAGEKSDAVVKLVSRYVDPKSWIENALVARAIIGAALVGVPDEVIDEGKAEAEQGPSAPEAGVSASPASMAAAP